MTRRGSVLAEHLAAIAVVAMVVLWVVLVQTAYQTQVAQVQRALEARYAARVALQLLAPGETGSQSISVGQHTWQVTVTNGGVEALEGGQRFAFTFGNDDD
ncbi:hypothetical protein [Lacticaseibacillus salsurivasis]|uniref:hypothetical protein n=1 Tax=Lacticaseibacillus salsurivasis TaxID=3081441 RepID=UPI0030C7604E